MNGALDLMGLSDPLMGYEYSVVVDSCLLSVVASLWILCAPQPRHCVSLLLLRLKLRHLRDPGSFVRGGAECPCLTECRSSERGNPTSQQLQL